MEYARRFIARRGRLLRLPVGPGIRRDSRGFGGPNLRDRANAAVARRRAGVSDLAARFTQMRGVTDDLRRLPHSRGTMLRIACAAGAVVLLLFTIASSGSEKPAATVLGDGIGTGAPSSASAAVPSSPAAASGPTAPSVPITTTSAPSTSHPSSTSHAVHSAPVASHAASSSPAAPSVPNITITHPVTTTTSHPSTTHTTTHATTTTHAPAVTHTAPAPAAPAEGCSLRSVHCGGALIYGDSAGGLAAAPAMSPGAYLGLGLHTPFTQVTEHFGAPLGQADLKAFLGVGSLSSLADAQPGGATCAYYLNAAKRAQRAYQLCFNGSYELVQKAVITTSGG